MSKPYDYLIVGAGLFGSVFANRAKQKGKRCLIIDRRDHFAGNIFCENVNGINVHKYGAHIFHTNDDKIWAFVNQFAEFNRYTNSPVAISKGNLYNLPFNMNTFHQIWGVKTPEEALQKIDDQKRQLNIINPKNLEEQALSLVGSDIYHLLIKDYTEKQWGRKATELPAFIIKRLPVRFTFDNNYFSDKYQGIPIGGYTKLVENMIAGIEVRLNTDYFTNQAELKELANTVVYTGMIDQYFDYRFGMLSYRSLRFEHEILETDNYQGNAVVNYIDADVPFTRIIEHKHFEFGNQDTTVITREYPSEWKKGDEPYYPVNDDQNTKLFKQYEVLSRSETGVIFGGRLADYRYYDMHQVVGAALKRSEEILS